MCSSPGLGGVSAGLSAGLSTGTGGFSAGLGGLGTSSSGGSSLGAGFTTGGFSAGGFSAGAGFSTTAGFSAGGFLVAEISTHFDKRLYQPVDAADQESARPDFAMAIYPGHLALENGKLNPNVPVTRATPPTFIVQAENDDVDGVQQALVYFSALKRAGVPTEMHLYAQGGHAFGVRRTDLPITRWTDLADAWMRTIGVLPR